MELRDYQHECVDAIEKTFQKRKRQLIVLPTGAGKTVIFCEYLKNRPIGNRGLIVVPTIDLVNQTLEVCKKINPKWKVNKKRKNVYHPCDILIVTAASLVRDASIQKLVDLGITDIIIDEAHKSACDTYRKFIKLLGKDCRVLGCTATPDRLDGQDLLDIFHVVSYSNNIVDLIKMGYLCDLKGYRVLTKDKISWRDMPRGDLSITALNRLDNNDRNRLILDVYKKNCINKKTLIFCLSVLHAEKCAHMLSLAGYKSECIHGNISKTERERILKDFQVGKIQVLTNCQLLTEGFDEPSIEALIMARPTASRGLYVQMIGRGARIHPGKEHCDIYDFSMQTHKLVDFDVVAGRSESKNPYRCEDGRSLTERVKIYDELPDEIETIIESHDLINASLMDRKPLSRHLESLAHIPEYVRNDLTLHEALFLIWFEKLKATYGTYIRETRKASVRHQP